tara:strand:+ start:1404 stop:2384 length:981 start_codon:yes stop_codon:yes gene_type:complete
MSEPIMKPDPSSMSTTSDDGYWEFVDGQWLATEKQLNFQKEEKPGDKESKEIEAPIFNKNILPLFPFVIALLIYSLFSNSWYSADVFEKETWDSDDERLLGQISIGLNELESVSAENSEEVTTSSFAEGCEETSTSLEEESCDSILFGKNVASALIILAIVFLMVLFVCGMFFTELTEQKDLSKVLIWAGHSSILAATLWGSILPGSFAETSNGIGGFDIAYWGVIFAGLLSYFAYIYCHGQNARNFDFLVDKDKLFFKELSHQIILFAWFMFVIINASLGFVVTTGPLLLQSSLVSLGLLHLVGMSIIGHSINLQKKNIESVKID